MDLRVMQISVTSQGKPELRQLFVHPGHLTAMLVVNSASFKGFLISSASFFFRTAIYKAVTAGCNLGTSLVEVIRKR